MRALQASEKLGLSEGHGLQTVHYYCVMNPALDEGTGADRSDRLVRSLEFVISCPQTNSLVTDREANIACGPAGTSR